MANINDSKLTSFVLPFCPPNVLPTIITMQYTTDILSVVCITAFFSSSLTSSVLVLNRDSFIYSVFLTLAILTLTDRTHTTNTLTKYAVLSASVLPSIIAAAISTI